MAGQQGCWFRTGLEGELRTAGATDSNNRGTVIPQDYRTEAIRDVHRQTGRQAEGNSRYVPQAARQQAICAAYGGMNERGWTSASGYVAGVPQDATEKICRQDKGARGILDANMNRDKPI